MLVNTSLCTKHFESKKCSINHHKTRLDFFRDKITDTRMKRKTEYANGLLKNLENLCEKIFNNYNKLTTKILIGIFSRFNTSSSFSSTGFGTGYTERIYIEMDSLWVLLRPQPQRGR